MTVCMYRDIHTLQPYNISLLLVPLRCKIQAYQDSLGHS